jgi:predicted phosphodiesterase
MSYTKVSDAEIRTYLLERPNVKVREASKILHIHSRRITPIRNAIRDEGIKAVQNAMPIAPVIKSEMPTLQTVNLELPASPRNSWNNYPQLDPGILVMSDLHVPCHDKAWIETVVNYALSKNIRRLLIAGDLLDLAQFAKWPGPTDYNVEMEMDLAEKVLKWLKQYFTQIDIVLGNHDRRFAKKLDNQISPTAMMSKWFAGLAKVHHHDHALVGNTWLVSHPGTYSRVPTKPAYDMCAVYGKNVAVAHTHKLGMARDVSGTKWGVEIGMCADDSKFAYKHMTLTTHPRMQKGSLIIHANESPELLHEDLFRV